MLLAIGSAVTVGMPPVFLVGGPAVQIRAELGLPVRVLGLARPMFFTTSALVGRPRAAVTEWIGPTVVLGFGAEWAWPGVFNYAVAARLPDRVATATSVTQTGVYLRAGGGPLLSGLVAEHSGTATAWLPAV